jgi:succinate dehydrogenase / fumarate reductase cytochrome b subunit
MKSPRVHHPVFLNLLQIRFPIGAIASIGHRISGVILALSLPFLVAAFERSLNSESAYHQVLLVLRSPIGIGATLILCLALVYHVMAGVRHLLMDMDIGSSLPVARKTAWAVLASGVIAAAIIFAGLWS